MYKSKSTNSQAANKSNLGIRFSENSQENIHQNEIFTKLKILKCFPLNFAKFISVALNSFN